MKMKSKMKTAMAVAAVTAVGAFAPAMASADTWSSGGSAFAGPAQFLGPLTTNLPGGIRTTCNTILKADVDNGGGLAQGQLQAYLPSSCFTNLPNCTVSYTMYAPLPRPITTSGTNVTFSQIYYTVTFGGGSTCSASGSQLNVSGSMTGSVPSGTNNVVFNNSPGLSSPAGPVTVSGTLRAYAQNAAGNYDPTRPITLQP